MASSSNNDSEIFIAAQNGSLPQLRMLLPSSNINSQHSYTLTDGSLQTGATPLFISSRNGHKEVVEVLLAGGANINAPNNGITPLYIACQQGHKEVVEV